MKKVYLFLVTIALLVSCAPKKMQTPEALIPINVCFSALSGTQVVPWYAFENGLFEKYGLQVNMVSMSGGKAAITTLISGDMDICQVAAASVINSVAANQDTVIIAGLINKVVGSIMAQPEITDLDMLKGKTFGVDMGGSTDATTRLVLESLGMDVNQDVILFNIGGTPEKVFAMEARQIDATFIGPPNTMELRKKGFVELYNVSKAKIPYQQTTIVTTHKYLAGNRSVATNFMKAIQEAIIRIKRDPEGTKAVLAQYLSMDPVADADSLQETYDAIMRDTLEINPYPTLEGLQVVIDTAAQENPDAAGIKPEDVIDTSILLELEESDFLSSIK